MKSSWAYWTAPTGVFDDCQNLVKAVNADAAFKTEHSIGAVNSINFGRIAAQIVYYVWAWLRVSDDAPERARSETRVDVAVPSGNFGNIYAGHLARSMVVPIRRLILATNENNVLDEFFRTGVYAPRRRLRHVRFDPSARADPDRQNHNLRRWDRGKTPRRNDV